MITVFEMLRRDAQLAGVGRLPEWQSSHPDPGNRIQDVQQMVAASTEDFSAMKVGEDEFLRRLDGMVYGEDPRAGHFEGARTTVTIHGSPAVTAEFSAPGGTWPRATARDVRI